MLKWALIFAVVAIVAGVLGFSGLAGVASSIAKGLFVLFLVIVAGILLLGFTAYRAIRR